MKNPFCGYYVSALKELMSCYLAVKVALDFAKKDKHTVVIAVTDHGNGGITIGDRHLAEINGKLVKMNGLTVYNGVTCQRPGYR